MITELYTKAVKRRMEAEANVFVHPPRDWAEFQRRLGAWGEVDALVTELEAIIKGKEDES